MSENHDQNYEEMYSKLTEYETKIHAQNKRRIKVGIRLLWIVPAVFFVLMFITGSSKLIFLVLWIISLFLMAAYLIYVEYSDYKLQEQMKEVRGVENHEEPDVLIDIPKVNLRNIAQDFTTSDEWKEGDAE